MTTAEISIKLTVDDLIKAIKQLPSDELTKFVRQAIAIQSERGVPLLIDEEEQALLTTIEKQKLDEVNKKRLDTLREKSRVNPLTPQEHAELLHFVQQVEQQNLMRVEALVKLAQKRGTTLPVLMQELGLEATYA